MGHPESMLRDLMEHSSPRGATAPPFIPLAFRLATSFGLLVLHLAFPPDPIKAVVSESLYLLLVSLFFIEAVWEIQRSLNRGLGPFETPGRASIRSNLAMDIALVALLIAFQGVDQERFAAIYLFPILSSAFYLGTTEIVLVGFTAFALHLSSFLLFGYGILPPFGHSGAPMDPDTAEWILAFASLEIFAATLIVVLIRRNLEGLRRTLLASEAKVDDLSALHRRVVESMVSGLITTDLNGQITSANPAAEAILQRALPLGRNIDAILPVDLARAGILPRERRFEGSYIAPNGAWRLYGGNVAPLRDSEGNQSGHLMLFQDLTEIKALEERTQLSERLAAIGELSAGLAHELRNPLASILGCVQILKGEEGHAHSMNERALGILSRESDRVSAILTKFLDFTRPKPVDIRSVHFPDLIEDLRASWETDPRAQGLHLGIDPVPDVWVRADPLCAHQVFTNLLTNARKATEGVVEPKVHLDFEEEPSHLTVHVRDNGCGMDAEQLRTLFVPFSSTFKEGTGLGMSLVFQFVQAMGWDIRVQSQPALGTLASLKIPLWGTSPR